MKWIEKSAMFLLGGVGYVSLELAWRGWSHFSMFLAGGSCFLLLGQLNRLRRRLSLPVRAAAGAGVITAVELLAGLVFNRGYTVWDYRQMPANFLGQVCLPFSLLWIPVSVVGMLLYDRLDSLLTRHH